MDNTHGLTVTEFRRQLILFTAKYLDGVTGMPDAVAGGAGLIICNIISQNQITENDRKGIQEYAEKHGYSYHQLKGIVGAALIAWINHVAEFRKTNSLG